MIKSYVLTLKRRYDMKKCEYCAKEISYFDQYCDEDCHAKANGYYEMCEKYGKLFSVINIICVFGIPIGLFIFSFLKGPGAVIAAGSCFVLGLTLILLPFPTEGMISKHKIQGAMKRTRIFGLIIIAFGFVVSIFSIPFILFP